MSFKAAVKTDYKYGFVTDIATEEFPRGLDEKIVQLIAQKRQEPQWLLDWRLNAYRKWQKMPEPKWAKLKIEPIDYQDLYYYARPKTSKPKYQSLDEVDPQLLATFDRLGIPLQERKRLAGVAVDAVFDSVSVGTTHQEELAEQGIIFCSMGEAIEQHGELVRKYLGRVVPPQDNYFAALNAAVFTDGSFCYIPQGVRCPLDLSTYFRINAAQTGQFERTLLIADKGSFVNYLEGCTAPQRDENQLHAAVVELIALEGSTINYSTVQNWYAGNAEGKGGIYNFVTKRGNCLGDNSTISWTQVEAGSAITWKYPSCNLIGENSRGYFYSVALTNHFMQADTGSKMVHVGKNTKSTIISKGISAEKSCNSYRGLVKIMPTAEGARNYTQCDSMLIGDECQANTFPYIEVKNHLSSVEHEASTTKISEEQIFYCRCRGLDMEKTIGLIINGFCQEVFKKLPLEFSEEAVKLLEMKLENSVG